MGLHGEESGHSESFIIPGIKYAPFGTRTLFFGLAGKIPLSDTDYKQLLFSIFYHFDIKHHSKTLPPTIDQPKD